MPSNPFPTPAANGQPTGCRTSRAIALALGALGALVLVGWKFGIAPLTTVLPGLSPMVPITALGLMLYALALDLATREGIERRLGEGLAAAIGVYAAVDLHAALAGRAFGGDGALAGWLGAANAQPADLTLLAFVLLGWALASARAWGALAHAGALAAGLIAYFALIGYLYDMTAFYALRPSVPMALHTALALLAMAAGVIALPPRHGLAARLTSPGPGGVMLRRMLFPAMALPLLLGWIRAGLAGWPVLLGVGMLIMAMAVSLLALLWLSALHLDRLDARRRAAEEHLEATLRRQVEAEQARELSQLKDHLFSTLSHEIKTPLTLITGYAELLEDEHPGDALAAGIREGTDRLTTQLNRILDASAMLSGQLVLYPNAVSLAELVGLVRAETAQAMKAAGLGFHIEVAPNLPPIWGDSRRLGQLLVELLDNARRFSRPGGQVSLGVAARGDRVVLAVTDAGPGIPCDQRARVWEPFGQLDTGDANRKGGLGLGLTIVKAIAALHGASVAIEDVPGGSRFEVSFPAHVEPGAP